MKPVVDTKSPPVQSHVVHKLKKKQVSMIYSESGRTAIYHLLSKIEEERAEIIKRDNLTLLHKMKHIMSTSNKGIDHMNPYKHHRYSYLFHTLIIQLPPITDNIPTVLTFS